MAPLVLALKEQPGISSRVCVTAQHREMLDQVLGLFNIDPEYDLDIMSPGQTLGKITSKVLEGLEHVYADFEPDLVLVHGDTCTTFAASLAAYYKKIPIGTARNQFFCFTHMEFESYTMNIYANRQPFLFA